MRVPWALIGRTWSSRWAAGLCQPVHCTWPLPLRLGFHPAASRDCSELPASGQGNVLRHFRWFSAGQHRATWPLLHPSELDSSVISLKLTSQVKTTFPPLTATFEGATCLNPPRTLARTQGYRNPRAYSVRNAPYFLLRKINLT